MKGVISFVVASVFLLVLVSSAAKLPQRAPDYSYQPIVAMHLQQSALQAAFSNALSEAAAKAIAVSAASGAGAPSAVRAALYLSALDFEAQARAQGYDAVFWCGKPSEVGRQAASERMALEGRALLPDGALLLSNPACAASFDANLLKRKALVRDAGFSLYSRAQGMGYAVQLPDGFEVDIGG